jgi:hypothetical protein
VRAYHPDRYAQDPDKQAVYEKLTAAINEARDNGDLETLRAIAKDPEAFIANQGWQGIGIDRDDDREDLRKLYEAIEVEIVERLEALSRLRESAEYELMMACRVRPELLDRVARDRGATLLTEIEGLQKVAEQLAAQIEELTGEQSSIRMRA